MHKINKDLADLLFTAQGSVKDENSKFSIEEGTIIDAPVLLSESEEELRIEGTPQSNPEASSMFDSKTKGLIFWLNI